MESPFEITVYLRVGGAAISAELPRSDSPPAGKLWARLDPARLLLLREETRAPSCPLIPFPS